MKFFFQVNVDIILNCGKHLLIVSIVYQLLRSLMKKFFVVMEVNWILLDMWGKGEGEIEYIRSRIALLAKFSNSNLIVAPKVRCNFFFTMDGT
jgi:hypothetical protein